MTQTLYDSLQGLNSEVITVGTLLGTGDFADGGNTNDEEDLFQCGKCKKQFFSLLAFMAHKKTHQLNDFQSSQKLLTETAAADEPHPVALLQPDDDDRLQLQPIILSESDILSFSIGQSGLSLSSSEQVLNGFEDSEALLMPEEEDSQLKDSSDMAPNLQFRSAQIILTTQISKDQPIQMVLPNVPGQDTEPSYSLDSHILTLGEPSMLEQCTEDEGENQELESAVKSHEGKPKLNCLYCGKEFTKNFDLQQHMRCHTGERPFQCVVCGRSFTQKSNVKKHMRTHKVWPQKIRTLPEKPLEKMTTDSASQEVVVNDLFVCQYCPATFSSFTQLKSHRKTHADSKIFRCIQTKCGQTFESLQEFLQHTASHQSQDDVEYRCCVCRLAFNNLDELGTHQNTHPLPIRNKQGPFSCKVCKSKFATVEAYDRHQTEDTHFYPCPECSKTYVSERHLRRHLNTHSSYSTHLCPDCGKTFKTAQNLNLHKLIHTGERSYKCKMCSASFVRQDRLMRHMMMHDPSHRFKCPFNKSLGCKKEFYRKDKLKQHLLSHTSKHLKCKGCPRMFKQKLQLTRHEAVCVGENKPCKDCGHVTASLDRYKKSSVKGKEETHVNRRKHRLLESRKMLDDGVPTIQVVVVPLNNSEVPLS